MSKYKIFISFHFKHTSSSEKAVNFLEYNLIKFGKEYGCKRSSLWQDQLKPRYMIWEGCWTSLKGMDEFSEFWEAFSKKAHQKERFWTSTPKRITGKIRATFKAKKKTSVSKSRAYSHVYKKAA
jgi:hypothetical protein